MSGDYLDKVRSELGLFERIARYIPGYRGYKEKELRRETDRIVRSEVVNRLKAAKRALGSRLTNPSILGRLPNEDIFKLDALMYRFDRVIQRIDRAVAGYAGLFDAVKIREGELDAVIAHDLGLIEIADSIRSNAEKTAALEPGTAEWRAAIDELISKVEELDKLVDKRADILRGLELKDR